MPAGTLGPRQAGVPELHVDVREPAGGVEETPAVLLHGWASGSVYWEPLARRLLDAGRPVWIVDLPGYHPDDVLPESFEWTLESAATAVAAAIRQRTTGPVHVAGHSLGGSVALTVAARFPDVVATLALVGMVPAPPSPDFRSMLLPRLDQGFLDDQTKARCMDAWYGPLSDGDRALLSRGFEVPFGVLGPSGLAAMQGVPTEIPSLVTAPTLVLVGQDDKVRTPAQVREFVEADPSRHLAAVPEAGHTVHWEQPGPCAAALEDFWGESAAIRRKMSDI